MKRRLVLLSGNEIYLCSLSKQFGCVVALHHYQEPLPTLCGTEAEGASILLPAYRGSGGPITSHCRGNRKSIYNFCLLGIHFPLSLDTALWFTFEETLPSTLSLCDLIRTDHIR